MNILDNTIISSIIVVNILGVKYWNIDNFSYGIHRFVLFCHTATIRKFLGDQASKYDAMSIGAITPTLQDADFFTFPYRVTVLGSL